MWSMEMGAHYGKRCRWRRAAQEGGWAELLILERLGMMYVLCRRMRFVTINVQNVSIPTPTERFDAILAPLENLLRFEPVLSLEWFRGRRRCVFICSNELPEECWSYTSSIAMRSGLRALATFTTNRVEIWLSRPMELSGRPSSITKISWRHATVPTVHHCRWTLQYSKLMYRCPQRTFFQPTKGFVDWSIPCHHIFSIFFHRFAGLECSVTIHERGRSMGSLREPI